jgi:hypothetical protein
MSAPTESQHLAEFVVGTTAGQGLQPAVRLRPGRSSTSRSSEPRSRACARCLELTTTCVAASRTTYRPPVSKRRHTEPRGANLAIPCVLDHGASPPRQKHRGEARIPRSDDETLHPRPSDRSSDAADPTGGAAGPRPRRPEPLRPIPRVGLHSSSASSVQLKTMETRTWPR